MKLKDLFNKKSKVFEISLDNGYGYIQELTSKSPYFYIVFNTVFHKPIALKQLDNTPYYVAHFNNSIDEEIQEKFKHSYNNDTTKIGIKKIGKRTIPKDWKSPLKLRTVEYNFITYKYKWIVLTPDHKYIRTEKTCEKILDLPPYWHTVGKSVDWWQNGITPSTWNDDYCKSVIAKRKENDLLEDNFIDAISDCSNNLLERINLIKNKFESNIQKETLNAQEHLITFYKDIENLLNEENVIDTPLRESLISYVYHVLSKYQMANLIDECEQYRSW